MTLKEVEAYLVDICKHLTGIRRDDELKCLFFETDHGFTSKLLLKDEEYERLKEVKDEKEVS